MGKNILLKIEYDGSVFHGWQRQPDRPTVQGHLENILSQLLKEKITISGTSRTDAGVHAYGQMASFVSDIKIPVERIPKVLNDMLAGHEKRSCASSPVRIVSAEEKELDFHARFDSKGKKYIYRIRNAESISVFMRNYVYHVDAPLDTEAMREAAGYVQGTHDFKSFEASGGTPRKTTVRTVYGTDITESPAGRDPGRDIEISISGDGFLYNMVRIITGTLVDIGLGRMRPEDMKTVIEAADRRRAGHTAPPYGLYLKEVYY